ncbi:MAG: hypothetical protein LUH82_03030 [Clostridiales bacterium]|nr:hypothetical protein [Clostridiales bacterium]
MHLKKFTKSIAVFLAAVMFVTCFSCSFTAFAADGTVSNNTNYHDSAVDYNSLGWAELTDEQTATAVLDRIDELLAEVGPDLSTTLGQAIFGSDWDVANRRYYLNAVVYQVNIPLYLNSVDEILETLTIIGKEIDDLGNTILKGDVKNINLSAVYNVRRSNSSSVEVIEAVFEMIYDLTVYWGDGATILKQLLTGQFDLGSLIEGIAGGNLYELLQGSFYGIEDGYEENLVNNLIVFYVSQAFGDDYITADNSSGQYTFSFADASGNALTIDEYLLGKLSTDLLQQINAEITYAGGVSSRTNYAEICAYMEENNCSQYSAALALGFDTGLQYTESGNVYIFRYDSDADGADDVNLTVNTSTTLSALAYNALQVAWKTAIEPTFATLDVSVKGYDNDYHDWYVRNGYTWDYSDLASNYAESTVSAWATARGYSLSDIEEELTYDRSVITNPTYTWQDIDSTTLFNKLLYSPLMDYYFDAPTGVLNLAVECTGLANSNAFFTDDYGNYSTVINGVNDGLVAIMKDLFPNYSGTLTTTGNTSTVSTITSALVANAAALYQYAADGTDANILAAFYQSYGSDAVVSESNFESSIIPFFISAVQNITMLDAVHDSAWNACNSFESIAALCLQEYLSYVLPGVDYSSYFTTDSSGYYTTTISDVIELARDAVAYVMYQYVPLEDASGNAWNVYTKAGQDLAGTDIFDLLNSVIVYYGNDKGIAQLLGFVDETGASLLSLNNEIWTNIDIIANSLFPVLGSLQYGSSYSGQFSSEDLIYNKIITGLFEISNGGVSNIVSTVLNILSADEITATAADATVYNLVKYLINNVFGARFIDQGYTEIVPQATSSSPFGDLIQVDSLAGLGTDDTDIGVIGELVCNVCEFTGAYGYSDITVSGMLYVLYAINSFTGIIPQLSEYTLNDIDISFDSNYIKGYTPGSANTNLLSVTNSSEGINRAIISEDGTVVQLGRAFVQLVNVTSTTDGVTVTTGSFENTIAPAETAEFEVATTIASSAFDDNNGCIVTYTVTYNIVDESGELYGSEYQNLTKTIYQYYNTGSDWYDSTYASSESGTSNPFTESFTPASGAQSGNYSSMTTALNVSGLITKKYMAAQLPNDVVIRTSQLDSLEDSILLWVSNQTNADKGIDCVYAIEDPDASTVYMAVSINTATGDIVNCYYHDYYIEAADESSGWVSEADLGDTITALEDSGTVYSITDTRFHVVCEYENIESTYGGKHEYLNEDGTFESIYIPFVKTLGDESETDINDLTLSTGIPGLIFGFQHTTLASESTQSYPFIIWDGETSLQETSISLNIGISANTPAYTTINIYVCDDEEITDLQAIYDESYAFISSYSAADFSDSAAYDYYVAALKKALELMGTPITTSNALGISPIKAFLANTETVTSFYGDKAYVPLTSSDTAPATVKANATYNTADGLYYQTAYTNAANETVWANPIYTNTALTDDDVFDTDTAQYDGTTYTIGVDAAGTAVVKVDGVWYLLNSAAYDTEWYDIDDSGEAVFYNKPYIRDTVQSTDVNGAALYSETTYVYRDANGIKVKSTDNWAYKLCETNYEVVSGEENLGLFTAAIYKLQYANAIINDYISASGANALYTEVMAVRTNLNVNNFDSPSYKKMVEAGREAESMISALDIPYVYSVGGEVIFTCYESEALEQLSAYNDTNATGYTLADLSAVQDDTAAVKVTSTSSLFAINEAIRLFNIYVSYVVERGYLGTALEKEISCAACGKLSNSTELSYTNITVDTTNASYTVNGTTYTASSNADQTEYSAESWAAFITALDAAVNAASAGNGTYAYKTAGYFNIADKDSYVYQVTDLYTLKTALSNAENNLSA